MRQSTRQYKADLEELADGYQEARDEAFGQQFRDFVEEFIEEFIDVDTGVLMDINKDDIQEFMDSFDFPNEDDIQGFMDSFDFPDEEQWAIDEYQSRLESFEDAKYEEMKDRRYEDD